MISTCGCGEAIDCKHAFRDRAAIAIAAQVLAGYSGMMGQAGNHGAVFFEICKNSMVAATVLAETRETIDAAGSSEAPR